MGNEIIRHIMVFCRASGTCSNQKGRNDTFSGPGVEMSQCPIHHFNLAPYQVSFGLLFSANAQLGTSVRNTTVGFEASLPLSPWSKSISGLKNTRKPPGPPFSSVTRSQVPAPYSVPILSMVGNSKGMTWRHTKGVGIGTVALCAWPEFVYLHLPLDEEPHLTRSGRHLVSVQSLRCRFYPVLVVQCHSGGGGWGMASLFAHCPYR